MDGDERGTQGTVTSKDAPKPPAGSAAVAAGTVGVHFAFLTALPFLIAFGIWTGICIYALVKIIGSAPQEPNPVVILLIVVGVVAGLVTLLAGIVSLIGKLGDPGKRKKR